MSHSRINLHITIIYTNNLTNLYMYNHENFTNKLNNDAIIIKDNYLQPKIYCTVILGAQNI